MIPRGEDRKYVMGKVFELGLSTPLSDQRNKKIANANIKPITTPWRDARYSCCRSE
jgi:hypothetical protein